MTEKQEKINRAYKLDDNIVWYKSSRNNRSGTIAIPCRFIEYRGDNLESALIVEKLDTDKPVTHTVRLKNIMLRSDAIKL